MRPRPLYTALAVTAAAALTLAGCASDPESTEPADSASMSEEPMDDMSEEPMDEEMSDDMSGDAMSDNPVYDFSAMTLDGETFEGASLEGSPAVLWFWAPWCPTCIGQIPAVTGLAEEYGDDVAVVGVGGLDDADAISEKAEDDIAGITHLVDESGDVWQHFGMTEQSTFVVLDADGEVVVEGSVPESELESVVADLVG